MRIPVLFLLLTSASALGQYVQLSPAASQTIAQPSGTVLGVNNLSVTVDPSSSSPGNQSPTMNTVRASAPVSVKLFGAVGDGTTPDTVAIQTAIDTVKATSGTLYFPCGTYILQGQLNYTLAASNGPAGGLVGEQSDCVYLKFTGSTPVDAVLKVSAPSSSYFFNFTIRDISIQGNANATHDLWLNKPAHINFDKVRMWGANTTSGDCLYVFDGVGGTYNQPICETFDPSLPVPLNGLVFDGDGSGNVSTTTTVISPIVEGLTNTGGIGFWLKQANLIHFMGCQTSDDYQVLNVSSGASQNTFTNCLFENGSASSYIGGYSNKIQGATFSGLSGSVPGGTLLIDGRQNAVMETAIEKGTTILSTASLAYLENDLFGDNPADNGLGTKINNATFANTDASANFPQQVDNTYSTPDGYSSTGINGAEVIRGQWTFGSAGTTLSPTAFTPGKSWKAILLGKFGIKTGGSCSACESLPTYIELTESANTIVSPSTSILAFAVDGTSGRFLVTGGTGVETYQGTILFLPDLSATVSGSNSMQLAGAVSATAFNGVGLSSFGVGNTNLGGGLLSTSTGIYSTAAGDGCLASDTSGSFNTCVGQSSLYAITTGSNLTALGSNAGYYISGGSVHNTTSSTSLYLGNDTEALANGDSNEIVIGSSAVGGGSNTVTLGNASVSSTILRGTVSVAALANTGTATFGSAGQATIDASGNITTSARISPQQSTPASSGSACVSGQMWTDADYIYVCVSTNSIKRAALNSF